MKQKKQKKLKNNLSLSEIFMGPQETLRNRIVKFLVNSKEPHEVVDGNIIHLPHPNRPVFLAHMDTVGEATMNSPLDITDGVLTRPGCVLGGDDRAGVWLIMNHFNHLNFILTRDEEIGGLGINSIMDLLEARIMDMNIPCGVVLDRKGTTDIIGEMNYYCAEDLEIAIEDILPKYYSATGMWCDADIITHFLPCVNLSVGYKNAHTTKESLDLSHLVEMNKNILPLSKHLTGKTFKIPLESSMYDDTLSDGCDICGGDAEVFLSNITLCAHCAEELEEELHGSLLEWYTTKGATEWK